LNKNEKLKKIEIEKDTKVSQNIEEKLNEVEDDTNNKEEDFEKKNLF